MTTSDEDIAAPAGAIAGTRTGGSRRRQRGQRGACPRPVGSVLLALTGGLLTLDAVHLERQKDVGEASEQREESNPDQQQHGPCGDLLLGDPEAEQELEHAR